MNNHIHKKCAWLELIGGEFTIIFIKFSMLYNTLKEFSSKWCPILPQIPKHKSKLQVSTIGGS